MRRFRVDQVPSEGSITLGPEAAHHLVRVIRASRGDLVEIFDGTGRVAVARLEAVEEGTPRLDLVEPPREARPAFPLHLVIGIPKGSAMDDAVRMASEAGATDIHPVVLTRSVAKGDRADRWERIAESAAQQCGRGDVPRIHPLTDLSGALDRLQGIDLRIALPGAGPLPPATGPAAVIVGPEGGLTDREVDLAIARGATPMGLGAWVLRACTAAAVAVAMTAP